MPPKRTQSPAPVERSASEAEEAAVVAAPKVGAHARPQEVIFAELIGIASLVLGLIYIYLNYDDTVETTTKITKAVEDHFHFVVPITEALHYMIFVQVSISLAGAMVILGSTRLRLQWMTCLQQFTLPFVFLFTVVSVSNSVYAKGGETAPEIVIHGASLILFVAYMYYFYSTPALKWFFGHKSE